MSARPHSVFVRSLLFAAALAAGLGCLGSPASAEDSVMEVYAADAIKQVLDHHAGKRAKVKLTSGQDLDGTVATVGTTAVHLSQ